LAVKERRKMVQSVTGLAEEPEEVAVRLQVMPALQLGLLLA
jgi:hypothetical protein